MHAYYGLKHAPRRKEVNYAALLPPIGREDLFEEGPCTLGRPSYFDSHGLDADGDSQLAECEEVPLLTEDVGSEQSATCRGPVDAHSDKALVTSKLTEDGTAIGSVPYALSSFKFHRIKRGDNLAALSLKYGVSVSQLKQLNREACFGWKLGHMFGMLLVIPTNGTSKMSVETAARIKAILKEDNERRVAAKMKDTGLRSEKPDDIEMYELRKAFSYFVPQIDACRIDFYLGEGQWNVREAMKLYHSDIRWEKQHKLHTLTGLSLGESRDLLEHWHWDVSAAQKALERAKRAKDKRRVAMRKVVHSEEMRQVLMPSEAAAGSPPMLPLAVGETEPKVPYGEEDSCCWLSLR